MINNDLLLGVLETRSSDEVITFGALTDIIKEYIERENAYYDQEFEKSKKMQEFEKELFPEHINLSQVSHISNKQLL